MKTRTRTRAVIVVTAASVSLLTGLALNGGRSAAANTPTSTTFTMPMSNTDMGSMKGGAGMTTMHDAMTANGNTSPTGDAAAHAGHHMGSQP